MFCGLGGFRLALESYGAKCVYSSDINEPVANVYKENFGDDPLSDITLVNEKDIELSLVEDKLERLFGDNLSDSDYLKDAEKITDKAIEITEEIMNKLYEVRDKDIFKKIKEKYPNIKVIIATNHVSIIKDYIKKVFNTKYIDDILVSAEMHKIKPNSDFYQYILDKYSINSNELLFLDDNIKNIEGAEKLEIPTIKVNKDTNLLKKIENKLKFIK